MKIKLVNSNQFPLKGTNERFWHLATLHMGTREFMVFKDRGVPYISGEQVYIEEQIGGQLYRIEDEQLAEDLTTFALELGILMIKPVGWYV